MFKPALDTVSSELKHSVEYILQILKRAYGDVRNARTQLNAFYAMYSEKGKDASSYVMELHKTLMDLVNNGHVPVT